MVVVLGACSSDGDEGPGATVHVGGQPDRDADTGQPSRDDGGPIAFDAAAMDAHTPALDAADSGDAIDRGPGFAIAIAAHGNHTCALLESGRVKCWGKNADGALGLGDTDDRGDEPGEMGSDLPAVDLGAGRSAVSVAAGFSSCARLDDGRVKCWGSNSSGRLGLGDLDHRGDGPGEMGDALPAVDLGSDVVATAIDTAGVSCARLDTGEVKCWGYNYYGQLGLGDNDNRGSMPDDMGDALPVVDLGTDRSAVAISVSDYLSCALLDTAEVKCWGVNLNAGLGLGDTEYRGDEPGEMGDDLPAVDLGSGRTAVAVATGGEHACAVLDTGDVKCWGDNSIGQLGLGDKQTRGDEPGEMGDKLPAVDLGSGRTAVAIAAAGARTCALLDDETLKCWGHNDYGGLGLGDKMSRGDGPDEMGDALPVVDLGKGRRATALALGRFHSCALLDDGNVKCWGRNDLGGQLGLGNTDNRGDEPDEMGDHLPAVDLGE